MYVLVVKSSLGILMTSVQTVILLRKLVKEFCTQKISSKVTDKAYFGTLLSCRNVRRLIREMKIHVYSIRQTANVSGEFLRIENKQLKKAQNDSCGQNYHKTTYFCVEAINGKRKIRGKTWSRGANSRLPFGVNVNLNLSINVILGPFRRFYKGQTSFPAALYLNTWNWLAILGKFSQNVMRFKVT